jgi:hypothetical protein
MSDVLKDGGQAFPCIEMAVTGAMIGGPGMTLRDWFAGQALIAIIGAREFRLPVRQNPADEARRQAAGCAYKLADAMLQARAK